MNIMITLMFTLALGAREYEIIRHNIYDVLRLNDAEGREYANVRKNNDFMEFKMDGTGFGRPLKYKYYCESDEAIDWWYTQTTDGYQNLGTSNKKDRAHAFGCTKFATISQQDEYTGFSSMKQNFNLECPSHRPFVCGIWSVRSNSKKDRIYQLTCCGDQSIQRQNCITAPWSSYQQPMLYSYWPRYMVSLESQWHNGKKQRRFRPTFCQTSTPIITDTSNSGNFFWPKAFVCSTSKNGPAKSISMERCSLHWRLQKALVL